MRALVRILRRSFLAILLVGACSQPAIVHAASCNGWAGNLVFGTVDLLAGGVTDSSSTISFGCSANPGERVLLCFSMGADPSTGLYDPRNLANGGSRMAFNLYTDTSRSTIWGSTASTSYRPVPFTIDFGAGEYYKTGTLSVFGRINATGQMGLPAGTYSTNDFGGWPMTISFKTIPGGAAPDCSGGGMQSVGSTYYISAVVNSDCRLGTVTAMDFGRAFGTISSNIDSTATITLTCNGGQGSSGYRVQLGNGANANGTQRRMKGAGYIPYELYQDPARSIRWGNYNGVDKTGVGNGQPQTLTVYGRVPPQTAPGTGLFTDTVVVTLVY